MGYINWKIYVTILIAMVAIFQAPTCNGVTDPRDVFAINSLHAALGFPLLAGWIPIGGDPCGQGWQGVLCVNSNITAIVLNGVNLGGELGSNLGIFVSIIQIDLSNNHIGGTIPLNLPLTMRSFFLSGNQFTGSIPETLGSLGQLTDLSLSENLLTGEIPDTFQQLPGLINMDLSGNNLSGPLPPSMEDLSSLTTLHLQNNHIIGTLDVLQNLPLRDLNIENNLFSGPIPDKLLNIPNFRRVGNPFNTTILPSPPSSPPPSPTSSISPSPEQLTPVKPKDEPSPHEITTTPRGEIFFTTKRITYIAIAGFCVVILLALVLCLCMSKRSKRRRQASIEMDEWNKSQRKSRHDQSLLKAYAHKETDHEISKAKAEPAMDFQRVEDHKIDMTVLDVDNTVVQPPSRRTSVPLSANNVIVNPIAPSLATGKLSAKSSGSLKLFTIASLQEYTNSFSQENLIGEGLLGAVYRAELPGGKLMAVKKLDASASSPKNNEDFLELVSGVAKIRHSNIVELGGYCSEHGQHLLIYNYCNNGTLHEALHMDDDIHNKLSWSSRIRLALGAAKALEYLHEVCEPPIVHRNFKSANILLDDELSVHVSDCGLAPLISSHSANVLQGNGYGAPELEFGSYSCHSDVYSFGVVMLELLTGRLPHDRSRPRAEQFLVRWAIPQLHDIDALSRMVDPYLNGAYPSKSLSRFADIISLCVQAEPEFRPPISEIVQNLLQMIQTSEKSPDPR